MIKNKYALYSDLQVYNLLMCMITEIWPIGQKMGPHWETNLYYVAVS
jgi:hypothetical protein